MVIKEKQQIVIYIAAAALVCGFVLFWYLPLRGRVKAAQQAKVAQELVIARGLAQSRQLSALKEKSAKLEEAVGNYERAVPGHRDLGAFLQRMANLMNAHNLKEQLIQPGDETETEELNCIPISMQCRGSSKQIFEFYKSLQGLDRLVRIEQVKLVNDRDFSGQVSMQTKAVIYYRTQGEQG